MIQDVKELRPELDIEGFGNTRDTRVLENGEIHGGKPRPVELIALSVAQDVGTELSARGRRNRRIGE